MDGPLKGVKVFDMTIADVGGNAAMTLALLGADVIKFEAPRPNVGKDQPPNQKGIGVVWMVGSLKKRSVILDFKNPEHRAAGEKLADEADILINNMRVGVADRLGFGYEQLRERNPKLLYLYSSAWGTSGPMRSLHGHDALVQAFSGFASINGTEGHSPELLRFFGHLDRATASYIVSAALLGLYERRKTGVGRYIELNMLGVALAMQSTRIAELLATGEKPVPLGSAASVTAPHEAFQCLDKQYLAVGVVNDEQWQSLCAALERPDLASTARFGTNPKRVANRSILRGLLAKTFRTKPLRWWEINLAAHDVPHGRFLNWHDYITDPQALANGHVQALDTGRWGSIYVPDTPWKFSKTPVHIGPPPTPGEHTAQILASPTFTGEA